MSIFIAFEGGEGSGKSTQAHHLAEAFKDAGIPFILTYEPGDTELGQILREALLDRNRAPMSVKTEALMFAADRAEHVEKVVRPALARGEVVICDRYIASSVAYQVHGGGAQERMVRLMSEWATDDLYPDVTFYLDIDPAIGLRRACQVKQTRFEDKDFEFHSRVREGFLAQKNQSWKMIDAGLSVPVIAEAVREHAFEIYKLKQEAQRVFKQVWQNGISTIEAHMRALGFPQEEIDRVKSKTPCSTCQGPSRVTVGMVCQTCGRDYGA